MCSPNLKAVSNVVLNRWWYQTQNSWKLTPTVLWVRWPGPVIVSFTIKWLSWPCCEFTITRLSKQRLTHSPTTWNTAAALDIVSGKWGHQNTNLWMTVAWIFTPSSSDPTPLFTLLPSSSHFSSRRPEELQLQFLPDVDMSQNSKILRAIVLRRNK